MPILSISKKCNIFIMTLVIHYAIMNLIYGIALHLLIGVRLEQEKIILIVLYARLKPII